MLFSFAGRKGMADVRGTGLIGAIELDAQGAPGAAGMSAYAAAWKEGVMARVTGDTIAFSPPLILEEEHVDCIRATFETVLSRQYRW
ncbi:MAG: aminotransferase class III-fold pyridoxal phosphate-dependent enzyme [Elusimicrobia bacterium]|nr:aminotransferase class III-fold pyridoxal phosphate-dependent enzyme [Elusimicrobiota bacterium]